MPPLPDGLLAAHVHAGYLHDRAGRLVAINQFDGGLAPRFYLAHDGRQRVMRVRADVPTHVAAALLAAAHDETPVPGARWPANVDRYRKLLAMDVPVERVPVERGGGGPLYWAGSAVAAPSGVLAIHPGNAELLGAAMPDWRPDVPHRWPFIGAVEDGRVVAVCASARITPAAHAAGVETAPGYRGRGLGRRVVAGWIAAVQDAGAVALYSTAWDNTASQRLAASLGLTRFGAEFHLT